MTITTPNAAFAAYTTAVSPSGVAFGFGNRLAPGVAGAVYPTQLTVVDNGTTLKLVDPNGPVSAVGLTKSCGNPYEPGGGPKLIGAKLSIMNDAGQNAPIAFQNNLPNGGTALYGPDAQYRLRIYTTAGISPDDVAAMRLITAVIIPASGNYFPLYNPGGPGNNPTAGVTYTYQD